MTDDELAVTLSPNMAAVFAVTVVDAKLVDYMGRHIKTLRTSAGLMKGHIIKDKSGGVYEVLGVIHNEDTHVVTVAVVEVEDPPRWFR